MYIRVVVYPKSKREMIKEVGENRFEIFVKVPAEQNLANRRVGELIASKYGVTEKQVRIISGHHSSRKILSVMASLLE